MKPRLAAVAMLARLKRGFRSYGGHLALLLLLLGGFTGLTAVVNGGLGEVSGLNSLRLADAAGWEAAFGDVRLDPQTGTPGPEAGWQPLPQLQNSAQQERSAPSGFWLRRPLPDNINAMRDPVLYIVELKQYAVYVDNAPLASYNMDGSQKRVLSFLDWHLVELPQQSGGHTLLLHVLPERPGLSPGYMSINEGRHYITQMLRQDTNKLVITTCFIFLGLAGISAFLLYSRDSLYLYFAILSLCCAYPCMVLTSLYKIFFAAPQFAYYYSICVPIGMLAVTGIFERLSEPETRVRFRRIRYALLVLIAACLALAVFSPRLFERSLYIYAFALLFFVPALSAPMLRRFRQRRDEEARWLALGLVGLVAGISTHYAFTLFPGLGAAVFPIAPVWYFYWIDQTTSLGVLSFVLCLGMVVLARLRGINEQLRAFSVELEQRVQERTAELELATLKLKDSVREAAETWAELSVLEERNRISQDIHDHVGHTLTASIVQLEAAKMLLVRNDQRGLDKLELSQSLVRKGLDDIRESVRMMKRQGTDFMLEAAVAQLVEETEQAAGVAIDCALDPLPPLTTMQKKVLYHALKEGLTNGIRHGRSTRFQLGLHGGDGVLLLELWNDGRPYTPVPAGFGLQSMQERVRQLGGTMRLGAGANGRGWLLSIHIPVS
ncbi:sensor histidine kinase [Paenibacillus athensensis]|nr:sensor histidine kinase [Paenibacillus athensensis]MCD1258632.1 sensor histidine kinase [Paenibacillus athensensis]